MRDINNLITSNYLYVMTMSRQILTVLMTVRNGEPYLYDTVASILNQTYRNFRFLILDNASTDNSRQIIRSFNDPRIELVELPEDIGQVAALNKGLEMINTPFVARIDADDISLPTRLQKEMNAMLNSNPKVAVVGSWMQVIDQNNRLGDIWKGDIDKYPDYLFSLLKEATPLYHPVVMFRRSAVLKVGKYDVNLPYAEDFDLWASLALAGYHAKVIPEPLCYYRVHEGQQSVTKSRIQRQNAIKVQERMISNFSNGFPARPIRLFFDNEDSLWQEISSPRMMKKLINALQHVLVSMQTKLNMNLKESSILKQLFYYQAGKVAVKGASLSYRKTSFPLFLFALKSGSSIFRNYALLYPFFYLLPLPITSPIRCAFRLIRAKI